MILYQVQYTFLSYHQYWPYLLFHWLYHFLLVLICDTSSYLNINLFELNLTLFKSSPLILFGNEDKYSFFFDLWSYHKVCNESNNDDLPAPLSPPTMKAHENVQRATDNFLVTVGDGP
jgi:hypothetical protein